MNDIQEDKDQQPAPVRKCVKRQVSDQYSCHECGLTWDVNDDDPPICGRTGELA